jgi:hypothetical protein
MREKRPWGAYDTVPPVFINPLFAELDKKRRMDNLTLINLAKKLKISYSWLNFEYYHGHKGEWTRDITYRVEQYLGRESNDQSR